MCSFQTRQIEMTNSGDESRSGPPAPLNSLHLKSQLLTGRRQESMESLPPRHSSDISSQIIAFSRKS